MTDFARTRAWTKRRVDDGPLPVAVLGVASSRGIEHLEAFGGADVDDAFALFSITKPLVALATARIVENGLLGLRRPLTSAVPGFGVDREEPVRLHHLLSHTAGIVDPALDDTAPLDATLANAGMLFEAGTHVQYSNIAFEGVAALVRDATGRPLQDQVEALAPGLTFDTSAARHEVVDGALIGFDMHRMAPQRHPAAGAHGTAGALLDIASSLLAADGRIVAPSTLEGMLQPRTVGLPEFERGTQRRDFGLGWHLREYSAGLLDRRAFGHAGLSGTEWWIYPERDLALVMLTNLIDAPGHGVDADELNNAFVRDVDPLD